MEEFGESVLLRAFFETADGGYYSPILRGCYELLPIPEPIRGVARPGVLKEFLYSEIDCRCGTCKLSKYIPSDYVLVGSISYSVREVAAHWDPRFDLGIYADYWRSAGGRIPVSFKKKGGRKFLFFAAGLAKYPPGTFEGGRKSFTEIRRAFNNSDRGVYVVAYMEVNKIVDLVEYSAKLGVSVKGGKDQVVWEKAAEEHGDIVLRVPHYARGGDLPVIIISENYGILKDPIPLIVWERGIRRLTDYSYLFGVRKPEDRIRHKLYSGRQTDEIVNFLRDRGVLI